MDINSFNKFDNACMGGEIVLVKTMLMESKPSLAHFNMALRHAVAYCGPTDETREDIVDLLIEHGAEVDWNDRGLDTITNAVSTGNSYVLKQVLNACDGNEEQLDRAARIVSAKGTDWGAELILKRKFCKFHIGL